jgi:hypothetical protein
MLPKKRWARGQFSNSEIYASIPQRQDSFSNTPIQKVPVLGDYEGETDISF